MEKTFKTLVRRFLARQMNITLSEAEMLTKQYGCVAPRTSTSKLHSLISKLHPIVGTTQEMIRLGPDRDGGYLVPNDLQGIHACFSPGVAKVSGFEKDCAERGMQVFLADQSVDKAAEDHPLFQFIPKYIGALTSDHFITIDDWVNDSITNTQSDLLLQMDIEGGEYEVILNTSSDLMARFRILVIEFHYLNDFWSTPFFRIASRVFEKILQTHRCVHLHPNNCCSATRRDGLDIPRVMEFTFLRNDRINDFAYVKSFPNPLDRDNTDRPTLTLPKCWYA